jgi:transcriptional regulator with XRE-family HTH domain
MAKTLKIATSPDTILNLLRQLPQPTPDKVTVVGVDDFSFRRGRNFGTILVDLESHNVIDLLPDIKKETVSEWLKEHPEIEIISRDRANAFAEAGRMAAPQALQIADRFHVAQNLWEACEALIKANYPTIRQILGSQSGEIRPQVPGTLGDALAAEADATQPSPVPIQLVGEVALTQSISRQPIVRERPQGIGQGKAFNLREVVALNSRESKKQETYSRRLAIYQQVVDLQQRGFSQTEIAQKLGTSPTQVRRYLKGAPVKGGGVRRKTKLDPYKAYLKRRYFEDHFDNVKELWREIQSQGYSGGYSGVSTYLVQLKFEQGAIELTGNPVTKRVKPLEEPLPSIRRLSWSIFLAAHRLKERESDQLNLILQGEPKLFRGYTLIQQFRKLMAQRTDEGLSQWLNEVEGSELEGLKSFGRGVRRDEVAVRAGLKSRWSQGPVEGFVNKLKLVKRSMFGRASFSLLRTRVLLA